MVPASQAARKTILEVTTFGVSSYILVGSESALVCLNLMVHGTGGIYMDEWLAKERGNTTASRVGKGWTTQSVHWRRSQAVNGPWGGNIYSRGWWQSK